MLSTRYLYGASTTIKGDTWATISTVVFEVDCLKLFAKPPSVNCNVVNKHPVGCEAQLARKCLYSRPPLRWAILTRKVGQTDLAFGTWSGFITRSVHARLQFSVFSGYIFSILVNTQTHPDTHPHTETNRILTSLYKKLSRLSRHSGFHSIFRHPYRGQVIAYMPRLWTPASAVHSYPRFESTIKRVRSQ